MKVVLTTSFSEEGNNAARTILRAYDATAGELFGLESNALMGDIPDEHVEDVRAAVQTYNNIGHQQQPIFMASPPQPAAKAIRDFEM